LIFLAVKKGSFLENNHDCYSPITSLTRRKVLGEAIDELEALRGRQTFLAIFSETAL